MNSVMEKALNSQLNVETYSSHLYLAMSSWAASNGLKGFANWTRVQAQEELFHSLKFFDFISDRGGVAIVGSVEAPPREWKSALDMFLEIKKHEQKISALINDLYSKAISEKDHASATFLHWFITEQVEEEKTVNDVIDQLKLIDNQPAGLYMLDRELAARKYTAPAASNP